MKNPIFNEQEIESILYNIRKGALVSDSRLSIPKILLTCMTKDERKQYGYNNE